MEHPTAKQIETQAAKAGLTISEVLKRANVGRESFYREKRGDGKMTPRIAYKLAAAVDAIMSEKSA